MRLPAFHLSLTWRFANAALVVTAVLGYVLIRLLNQGIISNALDEHARADAGDTLAPRRRVSAPRVTVVCPVCGAARLYREKKAARLKTSLCQKCYLSRGARSRQGRHGTASGLWHAA